MSVLYIEVDGQRHYLPTHINDWNEAKSYVKDNFSQYDVVTMYSTISECIPIRNDSRVILSLNRFYHGGLLNHHENRNKWLHGTTMLIWHVMYGYHESQRIMDKSTGDMIDIDDLSPYECLMRKCLNKWYTLTDGKKKKLKDDGGVDSLLRLWALQVIIRDRNELMDNIQ